MLINKNKSDYLKRIINELDKSSNIRSMTPGSVIFSIANAVASSGEELTNLFNSGVVSSLLANAEGEWLDLIGRGMYVFRKESSTVSVVSSDNNIKFYVEEGTFGDINNGNNIIIPKATKIMTENNDYSKQIVFYLNDDVTLYSSQSHTYVSATASEEGTVNIAAESLVTHDFTNYKKYMYNDLLVTNEKAIAGGSSKESDMQYRYRIANSIYTAQAGNNIAITIAAMDTPGVADIKINNFEKGPGTSSVYIIPTIAEPVPGLIPIVQAKIDNYISLGNLVEAMEPRFIGIELAVKLQFNNNTASTEMNSIKSKVLNNIINYINNIPIGETLYKQKIISIILDTSDKILRIGSGNNTFDIFNVYKQSFDGNRIQSIPMGDISSSDFEKIVCEYSINSPIRVY